MQAGKPCRYAQTSASVLRTPPATVQGCAHHAVSCVPDREAVAPRKPQKSRVRARGSVRTAAAASAPPRTTWGEPVAHDDTFFSPEDQVAWDGHDYETAGGVHLSDMDDVENLNSPSSGWGNWGSAQFTVGAAWEAQAWSVEPTDMPAQMLGQDDLEMQASEARLEHPEGSFEPQSAAIPTQPAAPITAAQEDDPARYRYHVALYASALRGDIAEVSEVLDQMRAAKLPPGPAALHSLVFAYVKAGDASAALEAARGIIRIGMAPLEETYVALVFGLVDAGQVEDAEGVVMSMYNAGRDTRNGWLALTKGLFRKGLNGEAFEHLQKGLQEGWNPDASLYEYVLRAFCGADNIEQAQRVLASMADLGVPPRTLHFNILVEAIVRTRGLEEALTFIESAFAEQEQAPVVGEAAAARAVPNGDTFCAIFRGLFHADGKDVEGGTSVEGYGLIRSAMMQADLQPGPKMLTHGLRWFLMDGEVESALEQISSLRTVAGEEWTEYVDDAMILALLEACGREARPLDLVVLLRELHRRNRRLPCAVLPTDADESGRPVSALASWLPSRVADDQGQVGGFALQDGIASDVIRAANLDNYDGSIRRVEVDVKGPKAKDNTVLIGIGGCAVEPDGTPMRVNKMLRIHLFAELEVRGASTEGKAQDLKQRVKLQRAILEPRIMAWRERQEEGGGIAMSRVQSLVASGMSFGAAMVQVQKTLSVETLALQDEMNALEDTPAEDGTAKEEEVMDLIPTEDSGDADGVMDEYGIHYDTKVLISEYVEWEETAKDVLTTYRQLSEDERWAYRLMEKYVNPGGRAQSTQARRQQDLEGVLDDAQATMAQGEGWDGAGDSGGLLGKFEGDLDLGDDAAETSLSDGLGGPSGDAGIDADEDLAMLSDGAESGVDDEDEDDAAASLVDGAASGAEDDGEAATDADTDDGSGDDATGELLDEVDDDEDASEEEDEEVAEDPLDLTALTNDSAGLEVAMECLRCARLIGLVVARGDFEIALAAAESSKAPHYIASLHTWALEQSEDVLTTAQLAGADAAAVRSFTSEFGQMARAALTKLGHQREAEELGWKADEMLSVPVSSKSLR